MSQPLSSTEHHRVCSWWCAYTFDNPLRKFLHPVQTVLGEFVKDGMTVMDVGCGMGYFSIGMAKLVGEPKMHVKAEDIEKTIAIAHSSGLRCCGAPPIRFTRTALFEHE